MRAVIGIDPGSSYTGVAVAIGEPGDPAPQLLRLSGVVMGSGDVAGSVRSRVLPEVERCCVAGCGTSATSIWLEEPPEYAHADVGHGSEARIGYALGWLSGLVAGGAHAFWAPNQLVLRRAAVRAWRDHMLVFCGRRGLLMQAPTRASIPGVRSSFAPGLTQRFSVKNAGGGGFVRSWSGCGHEDQFASFADLRAAEDRTCHTCAVASKADPKPDPAAWVRDEWKRLACVGIARFWPDLYAPLVVGAQERRRFAGGAAVAGEKPDHQLAGVADACEAAWLSLYALTVES